MAANNRLLVLSNKTEILQKAGLLESSGLCHNKCMKKWPSYLNLFESGELKVRVEEAWQHLESCDVCPRKCKVNRLQEKPGACRIGSQAKVSSYGPHHGEERPLSGWNGSGTVFFTRCNLNCIYCQNHDISQTDAGEEVSPERLAGILLELQVMGCHNLNLVTPSHVVPQILLALLLAAGAGLRLPLVYNSGGFDSLEMLRLLDGVVDIYMPDMKYSDPQIARKYSNVSNYPQVNRTAIKEMHRQVGDLQLTENGLAIRGLLVRHLVLPNRLAGSESTLRFLAEEISPHTYINLMDQYHPAYKARMTPELKRGITSEEYEEAVAAAQQLGLYRLD